jgi:hypothetical protein
VIRVLGACGSVLLTTSCAGVPTSVPLVPDERTTLHVGEIGALYVATSPHYSVGSAQSALVPVKKLQQKDGAVYLYRAVATGDDTFVLTPDGIPNGQCISCVTRHYFVTVVP